MASFVNKSRLFLLHGADVSNQLNSASFVRGRRAKQADTWGSNTRKEVPGNLYAEVEGSGFTDFSTDGIEQRLAANFGLNDKVFLLSGEAGAVGDVANVIKGNLTTGNAYATAQAEELLEFDLFIAGSDHFIGTVADKDTTVTASGVGNGYQLGALTAADRGTLYAAIFVLATPTGTTPTLDAKVVSDDAVGFVSPTDRITFTQLTDATGVTALFAKLTPTTDVTDDWFRFEWTVAGTTPNFSIVTALAVEAPAG